MSPEVVREIVDEANAGLLTKRELAGKLKVTPRTVENMQNQGLPHFKFGTRRCRYSWPQVLEFLNKKFACVRGQ